MNEEKTGGTSGIVFNRLSDPGVNPAAAAIKNREPMNFTNMDIVYAFGMIVIGFLYWNLINTRSLGFGVTLFTAVICIASLFYFKIAGLKQTKVSLTFLGLVILSAVNFSFFDGTLVKSLNFLFLSVCFVYWVCLTASTRLDDKISIYIISDMLRQFFVIPFGNFSGCFGGIRQVFMRNKRGKGVLGGIVGIVIFLPVLFLVVSLLSDADAAFERLVDQFRFSISANLVQYIIDFFLGLPVACYLFGLIYGNRYRRNIGNATKESMTQLARWLRFAPDVTVYSALTVLNLIYLLFFIAQASYLFSAFDNTLPETMTYAEYARRGFFELFGLSVINFAVIAAANLIVKRDKIKILRIETVALCIFTILLIITAMSKMGMYISYYGLTQMRVYPSWFMIVLLFLFVIILVRQFINFNGTRLAVIGCICLFLVLCFGNVDGMIAKYNIDRYQSGTLESVDLDALAQLSDGAIPYLYELYQETHDTEMKNEITKVIKEGLYQREGMSGGLYKENFRDINLQSYKANQIREAVKYTY